MMKRFNFNTATKAMLGAGLLSLLLAGCGGSDGKDGEDGKPGVIGVNIDSTSTLKANFTDATIDAGKVTVNFTLENANGVAVLGLNKNHDLRFGIAQLTPVKEKVGESEADRGLQWQSYINDEKKPGKMPEDTSFLKPSTQFQAAVEAANKCETCLVDNGDGSYSYAYQANIANVTTPVAVTYNADYTQRATLELEIPEKFAINAHLDWQPSTGKTEGIASRNVVSIETCYTCHQPDSLELHGGRRLDIENCASCHTATSGDPESGNSVDFTYMIHAIHKGADRKTVNADGVEVPAPYKIIGYGGKVIDYGKVNFPQKPAADCSSCHIEGANAPANADLFKADLSNTACIACHSEKPSKNHSSTDCMYCHNAAKPYAGTGSAAKRHGDVMKAFKDAEAMSVKFSDIAADANGNLTAKMQVLDAIGAPVDKAFVDQSTSIMVSWDSDKDFTGYKSVKLESTDVVFDATSKTYALTIKGLTLPTSSQTIQLYSDLTACFNNGGWSIPEVVMTACSEPNVRKVHIKQSPLNVVWNATGIDSSVKPSVRRDIIDAGKCQDCHGDVIYTSSRGDHHANGVNCGVCHTPGKKLNSDDKYPGGKIPSSFAWKAHEREGHYLKYAGVQSGTVLKSDCATCHVEDKAGNVTGIELGRSPDRTWQFGDINNAGAPIWVSSDAGACLSCHQKYLSDAAKSHIVTNGGILDATKAEDARTMASESCATCHTPAQLMEAHGN